MQRAYEAERSKIEEDCRRAREAARQRCLDQVEERRRKIKEDKESTGDVVTGWFGLPPWHMTVVRLAR